MVVGERQGGKDIIDRVSIRDQRRVDKREELRNSLEAFVGVTGRTVIPSLME